MQSKIRPVVGVDIDEVLTPFTKYFFRYYEKFEFPRRNYDQHTYKPIDDYGDQFFDYLEKYYRNEVDKLPPFEDAPQALQALTRYYDLVAVTSRNPSAEANTKKWLKLHFPGVFKETYFSTHLNLGATKKVTKLDLCRSAGATILIDDNLEYCIESAEQGIHALLFGIYPHNRAKVLPAGVTRVKDWNDVLRVLRPHETQF